MSDDTGGVPAFRDHAAAVVAVVRRVALRLRDGTRWLRRWIRRGGADRSGLAALLELHAVHSAGDAAVTVALAGTLFFGVPTGTARGRVLLYLLITMVPFAVIAPVIGPLLDRFRRGRRVAIAASLVGRAVLALVIGRAIATSAPLALYPAAFGLLVLSKTYGVSRSAIVPRVTPPSTTLVQANARISLGGLVTVAAVAPVAAGVDKLFGGQWTLRLAFLLYLFGTFLAFRVPPHADSPAGEEPLPERPTRALRGLGTVGASVAGLLRSAAALRALAGFLLLFVAFLVRSHHLGGLSSTLELGMLAAAAAAGGLLGTALGARSRAVRPELLAAVALGAAAAAALGTALLFGVLTVLALTLVASAGQSISKLALDAVVQRDVAEAVRTSTFARTETVLQLAWVAGGLTGVVLPRNGLAAVALVCVALVAPLLLAIRVAGRPAGPLEPSVGQPPSSRPRGSRPAGRPG